MQFPPDSRPTVLVVDDDETVRNLLRITLKRQGFEVCLAASGMEALSLCKNLTTTFAVVLLDVRMPGLDGPQTLTELQRITPNLACCFMTGDPGIYDTTALLGLGAAAVFTKPFQLNQLVEVLRQLAADGRTETPGLAVLSA